MILIPINHNNSHWTAAAINFRKKRIQSYDSMGMARSEVHKVPITPFAVRLTSHSLKALRKYLDDEHRNKKKKPFDFTGWEDWVDTVRWIERGTGHYLTGPTHQGTPQQENGYDCGVFTCQFLHALSQGEEDDFGFTQVDMPYLRRRMIWEIGNAQLRDHP